MENQNGKVVYGGIVKLICNFEYKILKMEYTFRKIPDDLPSGCCEAMKRHLRQNSDCEQHGYNCPDRGISYVNGKYLLRAPNANYEIFFCPWCGYELIETRARSADR